MSITVIGATKANLMDLVTDESVYVIKKNWLGKAGYRMTPIKDADVKDLLSDDVLIVKITNE
jgi:hypothetical protein